MTINKSMNISLTGLKANQAALNVVSHNIANMNTEGYAKQRVSFSESRVPVTDNTVSAYIGSLSGVKIAGITSSSNNSLNNYYRNQLTKADGLQKEADIAGQIADLTDELTGTGLGDSITDFLNAANSLNQDPTNYSLRVNFAGKAKQAASKFNTVYSNLESYRTSLVGNGISLSSASNSELGAYVNELNQSLTSLADINKRLSSGSGDASLETERDAILKNISSLADVTVVLESSGAANVKIGNTDLVSNNAVVNSLKLNSDATISAVDKDNNEKDITSDFTGGKVGGIFNGLATVDRTISSINTLASGFADYMNDIQTYVNGDIKAASYDRENDILVDSSEPLFTTSDGSATFTAANIQVNSNVYNNPDLIAAARIDTSDSDNYRAVGNSDNALEFYNAKTATNISGLGGLTMQDYILGVSTKAALESNSAQAAADNQNAIAQSVYNQILSETSVNLDEELSNMIMYRQAYNASARVFSACVEIFDTLLALGT